MWDTSNGLRNFERGTYETPFDDLIGHGFFGDVHPLFGAGPEKE